MKKHLLILIAVVIVLAVAGCKSPYDFSQPGAGPDSKLSTAETGKTVGLQDIKPIYFPVNYRETQTELTAGTPEAKLALAEASKTIGIPIPVPTYFPDGYQVTSVELKAGSMPQSWGVTMVIENGHSSGQITLGIQWFSMGMKIPPGMERIKIGDSTCRVSRQADGIQLSWAGRTGHGLSLRGIQEVPFEELVKVAESVTAPSRQIMEASLTPDSGMLILRGDSGWLVIHLQNNSSKSLDITISQDTIRDLPKGIAIEVYKELTLEPGQSADVPINVKVDVDAESPAWQYTPPSVVLSTDPPPPAFAITEDPACRLGFLISYNYSTYAGTLQQDRVDVSTRLRIDEPRKLPPGMVTLQEAEAKADFPVGLLLPSYFPEGANPVPVGYEISNVEPYSITAFYSDYRVVLSPEPGVLEPPASFTGDREIIRRKTVVIGQNRIDWWADAIHFSVISDEIPMSELKLVAESIMLIGTVSGSWLGVGHQE